MLENRVGKTLKPISIYIVDALPKTRNVKVMRRVMRAAYLGKDPGDLSALENPELTKIFRLLGEGADIR